MKGYGNVLAFTPQRNNIQYGNVVNQDFNQVYKSIHSFKVQSPQLIDPVSQPLPLKEQTRAEKEEELRDLMDLYYKVKVNEFTAQGAIQPAFQVSPYDAQFSYIRNTGLDKKRSKLLAVEEWKAKTGREFRPRPVEKRKYFNQQGEMTASGMSERQKTTRPRSSSNPDTPLKAKRTDFRSPTVSTRLPTVDFGSSVASTSIKGGDSVVTGLDLKKPKKKTVLVDETGKTIQPASADLTEKLVRGGAKKVMASQEDIIRRKSQLRGTK